MLYHNAYTTAIRNVTGLKKISLFKENTYFVPMNIIIGDECGATT
jgi:hypothetical protein